MYDWSLKKLKRLLVAVIGITILVIGIEYRKKSSQAQELFNGATDKFKKIMTATGASQ